MVCVKEVLQIINSRVFFSVRFRTGRYVAVPCLALYGKLNIVWKESYRLWLNCPVKFSKS